MASGDNLSSSLTLLSAVDCILGAIRDRVHVLGGAANRIARCHSKRRADQSHGEDLLKHNQSPS
jgi:hypothetical protein